jgi:hypothetical protein
MRQKMDARPGRGPAGEHAALPDRHGGLRRQGDGGRATAPFSAGYPSVEIVTCVSCSCRPYRPPDRSAAQGDLCHEAPTRPVTRPSRSSATSSIDNSLGGFLLHG